MKRIIKYTPEFVLFCYILFFFFFKHPENSWERVINSDGKGYYAYLTAIFIYHDLDYKFLESYEAKYYPPDKTVFKEFRVKTDGGIVNKCFPGLAILWLPFFLIAHLISYLSGSGTDGYSVIYQYTIAFSGLFYLWLGCRFLYKLLIALEATEYQAGFITFLTGLGTNLIYYTIIEGTMTHVYSFCLITIFLFSTLQLFKEQHGKWFVLSSLLFGLIMIMRPVNAFVILLVPVMAFLAPGYRLQAFSFSSFVPHKNKPETRSQKPEASSFYYILGTLLFLIIFSVPFLIWQIHTGHWIVYSYGDEHFNFRDPHFLSILFSFNRGWFIYTPIAFVSLFGFAGLLKENRKAGLWLLFFMILFIFVCSSWWMWYYASKCGQRIFIDILAVVAILLLFLFKSVQNRKKIRRFLIIMLMILTGLTLIQSYQHYRWIFPSIDINWKIYRKAFFSFYPLARVNIPDEAVEHVGSINNDMEKSQGWMNEDNLNHLMAYNGKGSSYITQSKPYSTGLAINLSNRFTTKNQVIHVTAMVCSLGEHGNANFVADFIDKGKSLHYKSFYLEPFLKPFKWIKIETAFYVPEDVQKRGLVKLYFFLPPHGSPLFIDDLKIEFVSLKEKEEFTKLDGVLNPLND